jgi:hypothetical protein
MRYALIICSCLCLAAWMEVAAEAQSTPATKRDKKRQARPQKQVQRAENPEEKIVFPEETIKGWGRDQAEAEEYALKDKAQPWVAEFLQKHSGIYWKPPTSYIRKNLVKGNTQRFKDDDRQVVDGPEGKQECWGLPVGITLDTYREMVRMAREDLARELRREREGRMAQRMDVLAKALVALVAFLVAVAGYFRLEDWTKGYYTWWLRAAVIGFLSFVALGLIFVA